MKKFLYFGYGANMHRVGMRHRCPDAVALGPAVLNGYRLLFRGAAGGAVATVEPKGGASVPGALWEITEGCLRSLDRFEGYPDLYGRRTLLVDLPDGSTVEAIVYVMEPGRAANKPSDMYLGTILGGYQDFGWGGAERKRLLQAAGRG